MIINSNYSNNYNYAIDWQSIERVIENEFFVQ